MNVHAISTGTVRISQRWQRGSGSYPLRLTRALLDSRLTDPLPIWCFVIEHPEGLIVIDTGIPRDANAPVWFPPYLRLAQRAATFQITDEAEEIGPQMRALGLSPEAVRWVVLTHLHQDHEGGLHHFPNAEFLVARKEWEAARGVSGRLAGYLNFRWPRGFTPTLLDFDAPDPFFAGRHLLTKAGDVALVPTHGHSAGHLSVALEAGDKTIFFAGDTSYTQDLLLSDALDGVGPDAAAMHETHRRILSFAKARPVVYLPSHEWASRDRLAAKTPLQPFQTGAGS